MSNHIPVSLPETLPNTKPNTKPKTIVFITENVNKFAEIQNYITRNQIPIQLTLYKPLSEINEIQSLDRNHIITQKTIDAYNEYIKHIPNNMPVDTWIMTEDTSLTIDKLGGFPGPFIKFYLQSIPLMEISSANWGSGASSIVSLGLAKLCPSYQIIPMVFEGIIPGNIVSIAGNNGFGYDPIFKPAKSNHTIAEMSMDDKEQYNARIAAFQKVVNYLC